MTREISSLRPDDRGRHRRSPLPSRSGSGYTGPCRDREPARRWSGHAGEKRWHLSPRMENRPMWEISKRPPYLRVARCSSIIPLLVGYGHFPSGKFNHLATVLFVPRIQCRSLQIFLHHPSNPPMLSDDDVFLLFRRIEQFYMSSEQEINALSQYFWQAGIKKKAPKRGFSTRTSSTSHPSLAGEELKKGQDPQINRVSLQERA